MSPAVNALRIVNGEVSTADSLSIAVVVGDAPCNRVHAIRKQSRVQKEIADRPRGVVVAGEQRLDIAAPVVVHGLPEEYTVHVHTNGRAVERNRVGQWRQSPAEVVDRA